MFPFFIPLFHTLFGNNCDCKCADRIIEYLEEEKYEWVPIEMTPEQRGAAAEQLQERYKAIDENPFYSDVTKDIMRHKAHFLTFNEKRLKESK